MWDKVEKYLYGVKREKLGWLTFNLVLRVGACRPKECARAG
jgi:hypothetical protein